MTMSKQGDGVSPAGHPTYVCPKCGKTFTWYKGIKILTRLGRGIALCEEHKPKQG